VFVTVAASNLKDPFPVFASAFLLMTVVTITSYILSRLEGSRKE
jgi:hypothetical protein